MSTLFRLFVCASVTALIVNARAADVPKNSPFGEAGAANASTASGDALEFAGVSTLGKKTMINLYDRPSRHGFWVQEGGTAEGVTVLKYDNAHDQVTVRQNGVEKTLPLRPPSAVINGPAMQAPVVAPPPMPVATPSTTPTAPAATPGGDQASSDPKVRARQEEEARMLVSDLLEIGMAQRKAYEDAQRRAAAGGQAPANPPAATPATTAAPAPQPTQPAATTPPPGT